MENKIKKVKLLLLILLFAALATEGSINKATLYVETKITLHTKNGDIFGTITTPEKFNQIPIALIISGSGPTDRDGNNAKMKNNSLKILATELSKKGIATLRYDKRGIGESKAAGKTEKDLRIDDYICDANEWIQLLKQDKRFSKIIVIGHSEGSLIGMIAAQSANMFISIAGAGQSADKILKEQLKFQPKEIKEICFPILDSLRNGVLYDSVPIKLYSLLRPDVQPYMISWFKYDPQTEIQKLSIPVLIIQGTNDIQVSVEDSKRLYKANPKSNLVLINKMNHIFRIIEMEGSQANIASYNNIDLPIASELVNSITSFILNNRKK